MGITALARDLRQKMTEAEMELWQSLRGRKLNGYKFLRQHPIYTANIQGRQLFYIADFYCAEKKLVVEVDGSSHVGKEEADAIRELVMSEKGIHTIRFANDDVLNRKKEVLAAIRQKLEEL